MTRSLAAAANGLFIGRGRWCCPDREVKSHRPVSLAGFHPPASAPFRRGGCGRPGNQ
ncbi:MAG: hypothetical protein EOQ28_04170 [Mesorhizobium sp.]|nr:MAG: hypothetical protein EOQ28_04170 [Mesorhizobium sp.]